jgi:hypothetical protein
MPSYSGTGERQCLESKLERLCLVAKRRLALKEEDLAVASRH